MRGRNRRSWISRSVDQFQENVTQAAPVAGVGYTLIGAILLLGGIGYAIDRWQDTTPWWMLGGLALGLIVGFYELAKAVWPR
jgi:F0F1-type ATP synthase assembly protein I